MNDINDVIERLKRSKKAGGITSWNTLESSPADLREFPQTLHPELVRVLKLKGVNALYSHQLAAWEVIQNNGNPVIVTPTASGKTLCYNLPVLHHLITSPKARALYIYPTKALAQDQYHELLETTAMLDMDLGVGTYDGDTPSNSRKTIRERASIILTNPDMLHAGILPHHSRWQRFFRELAVVVIDELHHYRGVFGSHLCNVLRRLERICRFHGAHPQYIMSSATLANPSDHAARMIGRDVTLINRSGAPQGKKSFVFYNPPVVDPEGMIRRSYLDETLYFARLLFQAGIQTIIFTRSRRNVELILKELRRIFEIPIDDPRICGYRGGYLPRERRQIERDLREGKTRCVVATSALELGIDVGDMGAAIMAGYPGTVASTWQRAGRAGRRDSNSLALMVASAAPLDQYMVRYPEYFFGHPSERGLINPDNLLILLEHIRCAAFELPFDESELFSNLANTTEFLEYLQEEGVMQRSGNRWFYTGGGYPAETVSLRSISGETVSLVDVSGPSNTVIGQVDSISSHALVHPEAVYIHAGRLYLVETLDLEMKQAKLVPVDLGYFTTPLEVTTVTVIESLDQMQLRYRVEYGDVQVHTQVAGYKKLKFGSQENLGTGVVTLPEQELVTTGVWLELPLNIADLTGVSTIKEIAAGFIGALQAIHSVSSVLLMCDPGDIGSCVTCVKGTWSAQVDHLGMVQLTGASDASSGYVNLFVYDRYPGGIGLSESLYSIIKDVVHRALELARSCSCSNGCPGCIGPVMAMENDVKRAAVAVLSYLSA